MSDTYIHPSAEVDPRAEIGSSTRIWHQVHIREGASIGKHCVISKDVYIDHDVQIGDHVKIQNGVSVYNGVTLQNDVFVGPHVTFTNDPFPRAFSTDWEVVPTLIKRGASLGAHATILCGIVIDEYAMVGAGAVVTTNVPRHVLVVGNPARPKGFVCKCGRPIRGRFHPSDNLVFAQCHTCSEQIQIPSELYYLIVEPNGRSV